MSTKEKDVKGEQKWKRVSHRMGVGSTPVISLELWNKAKNEIVIDLAVHLDLLIVDNQKKKTRE